MTKNPEYKPYTQRLKIIHDYINDLLRNELPQGIKYHNADHTLHPIKGVVAVANRIAVEEGVSENDRELLLTAAYFHDTGFIREYEKNESIAARMAGRILKLIGYKPNEIKKIQRLILSTDMDIKPETHLEKILCDADFDNLGRKDFMQLDSKLREGRRARGVDVEDDEKWYKGTLKIIENHQYYTKFQKKLRNEEKQRNIIKVIDKLSGILKNKSN